MLVVSFLIHVFLKTNISVHIIIPPIFLILDLNSFLKDKISIQVLENVFVAIRSRSNLMPNNLPGLLSVAVTVNFE